MPLLILLDFIFASIVLTLAGYLLSLVSLGEMRTLSLGVLAAILLLPIARQVLRARSVLRPPRTPEEVRASLRQVRVSLYTVYGIVVLCSFVFALLLLS